MVSNCVEQSFNWTIVEQRTNCKYKVQNQLKFVIC